jgi:hypothetical protein
MKLMLKGLLNIMGIALLTYTAGFTVFIFIGILKNGSVVALEPHIPILITELVFFSLVLVYGLYRVAKEIVKSIKVVNTDS